MEPLLFLAHRIPYPPNKGDKIRSFNLLKYLAARYRVHLGCFVDSSDDAAHVDALRQWSVDICAVPLDPRVARLRSLVGLVSGLALTLPYYRSRRLQQWVSGTVADQRIAKAVAFSSPMAQYLRPFPQVRTVVDLVDVDSAKWTSYANEHRWPLSFIYRREGERLLAFERDAVARAAAAVLVSRAEVQLFDRLAPECSAKLHAIENGVDSAYFAPSPAFVSPFRPDEVAIVFTGVMDYWPNVDAVTWFAREALPAIVRKRPDVRFHIVGMKPALSVRALSSDPHVVVTGKVDDVRPYLQHARAVVAPLRVARGVQNKILEAMSMARPTVISTAAAAAVSGEAGSEFHAADSADDFVAKVLGLIDADEGAAMGRRARAHIITGYAWERNLKEFDQLLWNSARPQCAAT